MSKSAIFERKAGSPARETLRDKATRAKAIAARLARVYPRIKVPLDHRNTFELLIATILSAQCPMTP